MMVTGAEKVGDDGSKALSIGIEGKGGGLMKEQKSFNND